MDWSMIGALGEVTGAAAVVVTLFYLARQIRDSARQDRREQYSHLNRDFLQLPTAIAQDESFADVFFRGAVDPASLSPSERARFYSGVLIAFRSIEALFQFHREGSVADWGAVSHRATMIDLLGMPGFQMYWTERRHWFSEESQLEVDSWLSEAPEMPLVNQRAGTSRSGTDGDASQQGIATVREGVEDRRVTPRHLFASSCGGRIPRRQVR